MIFGRECASYLRKEADQIYSRTLPRSVTPVRYRRGTTIPRPGREPLITTPSSSAICHAFRRNASEPSISAISPGQRCLNQIRPARIAASFCSALSSRSTPRAPNTSPGNCASSDFGGAGAVGVTSGAIDRSAHVSLAVICWRRCRSQRRPRLKAEPWMPSRCNQIRRNLENAAIVIIDTTGDKPNCYFEAGYAVAKGKVIIWQRLHAPMFTSPEIGFDLKDYQHILYTTADDLRNQLQVRLQASLDRRL